ncbi:MAG: hypothetical protein QM791_00305 [Ferruginibacter sp.]
MVSKLFAIKTSTDNSKIGKVFPQTDGMGNNYNLRKPNSVWEIKNYSQLDFLPDLDYFKISNSAKMTDFISTGLISACGFLISEKAKNIFNQYQISSHVYYKARVKHKMTFYENYFWLHFTENDDSIVDFSKSKFVLTEPLPAFRQETIELTFSDKEQAASVRKTNNFKGLFPRNLYLKSDSQDFFSFSFLYYHDYISSRLLEKFKAENISGLDVLNVYL